MTRTCVACAAGYLPNTGGARGYCNGCYQGARRAGHIDLLFVFLHRDLTWQQDAHCTQSDPELWYPDKGRSTLDAKTICTACPVRAECLDYAVDTHQRFGVWGGLSEIERRRLPAAQPGPVAA